MLAASASSISRPRVAIGGRPTRARTPASARSAVRTRASSRGDDDVEGGWFWPKSHDDDDDDEGDDDCQKHDEACAAGTAGNAAKAGTVAPPKNGLFTNGTAPVVQSN